MRILTNNEPRDKVRKAIRKFCKKLEKKIMTQKIEFRI